MQASVASARLVLIDLSVDFLPMKLLENWYSTG